MITGEREGEKEEQPKKKSQRILFGKDLTWKIPFDFKFNRSSNGYLNDTAN